VSSLPKWVEKADCNNAQEDPIGCSIFKLKEALFIAWEAMSKLEHSDLCESANNCCADECFCGWQDIQEALRRIEEVGK
jgi:hypothetical protein